MPDGSPQITPVWFDNDGEHILINTNEGRVKDRNMKIHPKVAMVIQDPANPFRYLQIRGEVSGYTREGADEHIDTLAEAVHGFADIEKLARVVSVEEIASIASAAVPPNARATSFNPVSLSNLRDEKGATGTLVLFTPPVPSPANPGELRRCHE